MDYLYVVVFLGVVLFVARWLWNLFGYVRCKSYIERVIGAMEATDAPWKVNLFMEILEVRHGRHRCKAMLNSIKEARASGVPPSEFANEVSDYISLDLELPRPPF